MKIKISKKTAVTALKVGVILVSGYAVAGIVKGAINNTLSFEDMTKIDKVLYKIGIAVIGAMAADAAGEYVESLFGAFSEGVAEVEAAEAAVPLSPEIK